MSLWPILALMTVLVLALVVLPLVRRPAPLAARGEHDLSVYRAQLRELARDERTGLLGPEEARAARLEIERRMLAADAAGQAVAGRALGERRRRLLAGALAIALPAFSLALYGQFGRPELPALPFAARPDQPSTAGAAGGAAAGAAAAADGASGPAQGVPPVETMLARLEERVAATPDDLEGWLRLGRAYSLSALPAKAVDAYERALALGAGAAEIHAALGEARIEAAGGVVTEKARAALANALELDPGNPRARFYQGLALLQRGERRPALDAWAALIADTPADAPYLPVLRERVTALAEDLGLDAQAALPAPAPPATMAEQRAAAEAPRGPTPEQMQALQQQPPEQQAEMIRGMVAGLAARLEAEPDDVEGWRMLARSYRVLGESAKAAEAAEQIARLLPDDAAAQIYYGEALLAQQDAEQPLTPALVEQWRRVAALEADHPQALFVLGRAAAEAGEVARARELWQRLLAAMPADTPQRARLEGLLDQLGAD